MMYGKEGLMTARSATIGAQIPPIRATEEQRPIPVFLKRKSN